MLEGIEFNFYHRWFDIIFLVSSVASMAFLAFTNHIRSAYRDDEL